MRIIEERLEKFFENKVSSFFNKKPLLILTEELLLELESKIKIFNGRKISPNIFNVYIMDENLINESSFNNWKQFAHSFIQELIQKKRYTVNGPIVIKVHYDTSLDQEIKVVSSFSSPISGNTINIITQSDASTRTDNIKGACLFLWDEQIFPIEKRIINIGRSEDNDIIIDNFMISRAHAQLRQVGNNLILIDLDSTSGTKVNGNLVNRQKLFNGDVIEIADISIIYSLDRNNIKDEKKLAETKILPSKNSGEKK